MEMVLCAAQTLFAALQCAELREVCSILGYKEDLDKLEETVETVKAVLLDAASKEVHADLSSQAQLYIDQLKDAVYDADDLLDEFVSLAKQKKLIKGGKVSKKVRLLFSRFNSLGVAHKMSRGVKEISKRLDAIASNHNKFGFKLDYQPIRRRREETCSYIYAQDIVGREDDVENIVGRLLDPDVQRHISCLAIVGMGGLGKTALAQLVYNDTRIEKEFPLRLWTCVSDEDPKNLDVKATLCKILHSATNGGNHEDLAMEPLQEKLHKQLAGKKYFLILDDVWNEDRLQWLELEKFLMKGLRGSWIVVTTRSEETALAVGDELPYKLKGLSEKDSWSLFVRTAFGQRPEQVNPDLVEIGQEIVQGCLNVPLAIRVVGTLLYGQGKRKWLSLNKEVGFGRIKLGEKGIKPILKLSYDHLESPLKICFGYCAMFPKDFEIQKEMLISLWIAQGYVVPLDKHQSIEDAAEVYFSILLRRCFFQDVCRDEYDDIISCKMHDLLHDIAQEVAGKEIHLAKCIPCDLNNKVRHLSYSYFASPVEGNTSFTSSRIRSCLQTNGLWGTSDHMLLDAILCNWICLRTLDLSGRSTTSLPNTLGKLVHLRYLDLSKNDFLQVLPISITKLHKLETLRLEGCTWLIKLPNDLSKLTNLRVLDTTGCFYLARMPRGLGKLNGLWKLPFFAVEVMSDKDGVQLADELEEIKALKNLKGKLHIEIGKGIPPNVKYVMENSRKGGYLREHQHLTKINITFFTLHQGGVEALLEDLQPHPNLRELMLEGYCGGRMPNWAKDENLAILLPNLVTVSLVSCRKLQHIAVIGKLLKLKILKLTDLDELEYIQNTTMSRSGSGGGSVESEETFFPSLEQVYLGNLPKLKGWWSDNIDSNTCHEHILLFPTLPRVSVLDMQGCPELAYMPLCDSVENLTITGCNVNLQIMRNMESGSSKLTSVVISTGHLKLVLPLEAFKFVDKMAISSDDKTENLSEAEEVLHFCSSSLRHFSIQECSKFKSVCGELEHLTALEKLDLWRLPNLSLCVSKTEGEEEGDADAMPWRCLGLCLRSLKLGFLPKVVKLPKGMRYLTALQSLHIAFCSKLELVPEWMPELTSLKHLTIHNCSDRLKDRCRDPTGEDWPNIQHIPHIYIW